MNRKVKIALFITLLIFLGLFRETLFININAVLYDKYFHTNEHVISPAFSFLNTFSYDTIYFSKWLITPLFTLLFWFVQKKFIWFLFSEKKPLHWLGILYLSLFLLAGCTLGIGKLAGHLEEGYRFSRIFIGILQSPAPCMVLVPMIYFYKNNKPLV